MVTVHKGNVWSFTTQALTAYLASPADGATNVTPAPTLSWQPGQGAAKHHVYFGDKRDAVAQGTGGTDKGIRTETTFAPGTLDTVTTYYWRVDQVKVDNSVVTGEVWSFTTCLPIEDFESYTDDEGDRIYETWTDGWTNNTGSQAGYEQAPFAERTIVHGGKQSLPLDYNNTKAPFYSEVEREFAPIQNWTVDEVDTLVLYVRGRTNNNPASFYVALGDATNKIAVVAYPDMAPMTKAQWTEWKVPLSDFAGVNLARIKKLYLGVGQRTGATAGGTGILFVDDIRLIRDKK
jgi:hypothetical protein